ncbi:type II secretion system protein [Salisediminibacterium beveridgei]|uniref:Choice-of-anchor A domain-containing protein n=1 Tax=Salisediminibacterium beveridgei TaxID=632773 RepID=A0A1D7QSA5_9BACI|nr:type II secretion system protein [Salisediminibacterium beveridgei]AOM81879.1 hypothetical protein BBEV_0486 [Salisediminibacterium beveridgei]
MKNVRNQSGITLIELLAALVIGTMVIGLITSLLLSTFTQADVTGNHAGLRQEANIILSDIRTEYSDPTNDFVLAFDADNLQLLLDNDPDAAPEVMSEVADDGFTFEKLLIYQKTPEDDEENHLEFDNGSLNNNNSITFSTPAANRLYVNFILKDENGLTFEVDTMVSRLGDYEDYQIEDDDEPGEFDVLRDVFIVVNELEPDEYDFEPEGERYIADDDMQLSSFDYRLPIWYAHRNYDDEADNDPDQTSFVYTNGSVQMSNNAYPDVVIVTKEDVTITDATVNGFIFAPDGQVTIANSDFEGSIIADRLEINGDSDVTFSDEFIGKLIDSEDDIPFEYESDQE